MVMVWGEADIFFPSAQKSKPLCDLNLFLWKCQFVAETDDESLTENMFAVNFFKVIIQLDVCCLLGSKLESLAFRLPQEK